MDVVVVARCTNYHNVKRLLETFSANCVDKSEVDIHLVIPDYDKLFFVKLSDMFADLHIFLHTTSELFAINNINNISDIELLETCGHRTYVSIRKLLMTRIMTRERVCIFEQNTAFIRKFRLSEYISDNLLKYYYSSRVCGNETDIAKLMNIQHTIVATTDTNTYTEVKNIVVDKKIVGKLFEQVVNKYVNLKNIIPDFIFEWCYCLMCRKVDVSVSWVDMYEMIQNILQSDEYEYIKNGLDVHGDEPIQCGDATCITALDDRGILFSLQKMLACDREHVNILENIYHTLSLPTFEFISNNVNNQLVILGQKSIIMLCGDKCELLCKLLDNDAYNLNVCLGMSGVVRKNDDVSGIERFVGMFSIDTFAYISMEDITQRQNFVNTARPKSIIVDNTSKYTNTIAKYKQPNTKDTMVMNTCAMFHKKRQLLSMIGAKYDVIVCMRPDLVSNDGKQLGDILLDILMRFKRHTIYVPTMYNSFGIADTFAIGDRETMVAYLKICDNLGKYLNEYVFNPEYLVYKNIVEHECAIDMFTWDYKIYRHPKDFLNCWWRYEFDVGRNVSDYLSMKTKSLETYFMTFMPYQERKYKITNKKSCMSLYVSGEKITLNKNYFSLFTISHKNDLLMRINIKYDTKLPNMNRDGTGWNLFATPFNTKLEGKGNNDSWAQFYIIPESDYYYLATYHTHTMRNRCDTFGMHLGVNDGIIYTNMEKCENSQWYITHV